MRDRLAKTLFAAAALPAVVRARLRLACLDRNGSLDLEETAERMSRVPPWRLPWLSRPRYLEACVHRLYALLPSSDYGPCLERSLLLLDLWSRCGLRPRVHLGIARSAEGERGFHAWVSVPSGLLEAAAIEPATPKHAEIWSY